MRHKTALSLALVLLLVVLAPTAIAHAQGTVPTTTTTAETTTASDAGSDSGDATANDDSSTAEVVVTLLFGLGAIVAVLAYFYLGDRLYFATAQLYARLGHPVSDGSPDPIMRVTIDEEARLEIGGPETVTVDEAAKFTTPASERAEATWTVLPAGAAEIQPDHGDEVQVTAKQPGQFTLRVERGPGEAGTKTVQSSASSDRPHLPFVGAGYGSIVIAIALVTVAGALGFADVLSSDAIATLFGALAGYAFLKASTGDSDSGSTGGTSAQS